MIPGYLNALDTVRERLARRVCPWELERRQTFKCFSPAGLDGGKLFYLAQCYDRLDGKRSYIFRCDDSGLSRALTLTRDEAQNLFPSLCLLIRDEPILFKAEDFRITNPGDPLDPRDFI